MLNEIAIENVAVIEKARASFGPGFNVLTGETGAGKSILIDSINAILGSRASRDIVRSGAAKASIWAMFSDIGEKTRQKLADAGYEPEDELLLQREITAEGKSTCRINGMPATAAVLRDVCGDLLQIHGQHDNQSLLNPASHLALLDAYAKNSADYHRYYEEYKNLIEIRKAMDALSMDDAEKARRTGTLTYEVDEIEKAALKPGEDEALAEKRNIVQNSQNILSALGAAHEALSGGDDTEGATDLLGNARAELQAAAAHAPELGGFATIIEEAYYNISDVSSELQRKLNDFTFDDSQLNDIESRLDVLYRLKQKYGGTVEDIIAYGEKARAELESITLSDETLETLRKQEKEAGAVTKKAADVLTKSRTEAFARLNAEIKNALEFLCMPGIVMTLEHETVPFGPKGQDNLSFSISTNPGETPKPLSKIASGGELSRIMLAIKSALAEKDEIGTVIYDEIDTGISGLAAGRIGQLLQDTSRGRQVICVTHTAQIAGYAARHMLIEKHVDGGRTRTDIRELDHAARENELARIISGDAITDASRQNAAEMLAAGKQRAINNL